MPMRRRARRNALRESPTRSSPSSSTRPAVGSTSRLMQRISVLLPVPDGPMIAVTPRAAMSRLMSLRTGLPGTYDFDRRLSESISEAWSGSVRSPRRRATALRTSASLLLRSLRRFARGFLLISGLVETAARALGHVANDRPCGLVVDRKEAVRAVERLLHFRRETVVVETTEHLVDELRVEIVRVGERRGRKLLAAIDDAEIGFLDLTALGHAMEHVGGDRAGVVVAGVDAHHRLIVLAGKDDLVVLVGREPFAGEERHR